MIDLHTHSTASDGTMKPAELVRYAAERGIEVLALTDHDTLSGLNEAEDEAGRVGIDFIPGIEISAEFEPGTLHILGYYTNAGDSALERSLSLLREGRDHRNRIILEKLAVLGYPLELKDVMRFAGGQSVGRPHIADALVNRGYVDNRNEAFDRLLSKGAPAYADKERMTPEGAVAIILKAGGIPVLAHPQYMNLDRDSLSMFVGDLKNSGLAGLEVYYYSHSPEDVAFYGSLAEEYGLLPTGGTDYHGPGGLKRTDIGIGTGDMRVPGSVAEGLKKAHFSGLQSGLGR
ncbi:hypothetical protein BMS3Abin14_01446 [bacterium BMS3Abin14]|nr:hypothetical protein BMS3Abin14_01446 [bacterium BMS3Abin14]